ncbi:MAG: hypothetical protein J0M24_00170 [Verrucomicrobia bacterium]|nr:hypothetical protein [Verrucomicrobiota bacterium]
MNPPAPNADDPRLRALLRAAHPSPTLPPHFQENVWRRLEYAERLPEAASPFAWLNGFVRQVLRPAYATAGLAAMMLAGALLGIRDGERQVHQADQTRYVAAVSPFHRAAP